MAVIHEELGDTVLIRPRVTARARFRGWLIIGALALGLLVALGVVVSQTPRPLFQFKTGQGYPIRVETVTVDGAHRLVQGTLLQRALVQVVPQSLRSLTGGTITEHAAAAKVPVVWTTSPNIDAANWQWFVYLAVADDTGRESEIVSRPAKLESGPAGTVAVWEVPVYPRRQRTLRLRFYRNVGPGDPERLGEVRLANPDPGPHPSWTAEALPARRRSGPVTFELRALETGVVPTDLTRAARPDDFAWPRMWFEASENGRPSSWRPLRVIASDPTGNSWNTIHLASTRDPAGHTWWGFGAGLKPEEPAYRLKVELAKVRDFSPSELWTVRGVPLPGEGQVSRFLRSASLQGVQVEFRGVAGPHSTMPGDRISTPFRTPMSVTWAHVRVRGRPNSLQLNVVRAVDDRGREFPVHTQRRSNDDFLMEVTSPVGTRSVDLTFAVHHSRTVEFQAHASPVAP